MSYSEFTLLELEEKFEISVRENVSLFASIQIVKPSNLLEETLLENIPLALEISTEKARSELIVAPILVEVRKIFDRKISLFSGADFTVDRERGLNGRCDFLISHSPRQFDIFAPVAILVEAKNDNIKTGIPQCIAEMIAAQIFNSRHQRNIPAIYGGVTTGSIWKFLKLCDRIVSIEGKEHYLNELEQLLGIFTYILETTKPLNSK